VSESGLSVLIVSYNAWTLLKTCLESVTASEFQISEIVVIDNASVDGSAEKIRSEFPTVRLIQNEVNIGHCRAVNQGFDEVKNERILLLDCDTNLNPNAIGIMSSFLDENPHVWMVAPKTYHPDGSIQASAKKFPSVINGIFGRQSFLTRLFPNNPISKRYLAKEQIKRPIPFQVEHVSAACIMFRSSILETVGKWDEGYHGYWVDADWCKRIQEKGGIIYWVPKAIIIHHEQNKRSQKKNPSRIINFHRGVYRFYRLHYTFGTWDPRSIIAAVFLTIRTLLLLLENTFKKKPEVHTDPLSLDQ
jgi:GT2 family glycosyltransferase